MHGQKTSNYIKKLVNMCAENWNEWKLSHLNAVFITALTAWKSLGWRISSFLFSSKTVTIDVSLPSLLPSLKNYEKTLTTELSVMYSANKWIHILENLNFASEQIYTNVKSATVLFSLKLHSSILTSKLTNRGVTQNIIHLFTFYKYYNLCQC
jgi:hypothetical protein